MRCKYIVELVETATTIHYVANHFEVSEHELKEFKRAVMERLNPMIRISSVGHRY